MGTEFECPYPGCGEKITHQSEQVALALFDMHGRQHPQVISQPQTPPPRTGKAPACDRPKIAYETTEEAWNSFLARWNWFKRITQVNGADAVDQLFQCCETDLGDDLLKSYIDLLNKSESDVIAAIKNLAVIPEIQCVKLTDLFTIKQSHGESIKAFYSRIRSKASTCNFKVTCKCENIIDYTKTVVRIVLMAGVADRDIFQEIVAIPGIDNKDLSEVLQLMETREMARNVATGVSTNAAISSFKRQIKDIKKNDDASGTLEKCPGCAKKFSPYKEGKNGWNKTPHKECLECWKANRRRKRMNRVESRPFIKYGEESTDTGAIELDIGACTVDSGKKRALSHLKFDGQKWIQARPSSHPKILIRIFTKEKDYNDIGLPYYPLKPTIIEAVADTGAEACLWSRGEFLKTGLDLRHLFPVKDSMTAATGNKIRIDGAILLRLDIPGENDSKKEGATMVYISPDTKNFYLSMECLGQLKVIPPSFPSPEISRILVDDKEAVCGCLKRSAPPKRPIQIPVKCTEENIEKMRNWLLIQYGASTFNACTHQPLPNVKGPPIKILVDENAVPKVAHTPSPIPIHWKEKVEKDLLSDEAMGIIERVPNGEASKWCHRMVVTRKHNGEPRRTVDLSPLNRQCVRETHAMNSPFQLARSVPQGTWKTVNDAWNGYHSVPIQEQDRHLTTFITPIGRFRYTRAPQGFLSSGDGYNRRLDEIMIDIPRKARCVDDTLLYDESLESHWWRIIDFLELMGKSGIVLNKEKFQFCKKTVEFAGFKISSDKVEPLQKYIEAIRMFPTPRGITDIRSWFGLVNQVAHYGQLRDIMAPFKPFLSPKVSFFWNQELENTFMKSKETIIEAIRKGVTIFDPKRSTCLRTDWSKEGIGYYLSQKHCECFGQTPDCCQNGWRVTLVGSRFLSKTEQRYAPVEGEMLGVAWALEQTRYFTHGCENLTVVTDHKPLVKLLGDRTLDEIPNMRLFRLKQRTLLWKFEICHLPGKTNSVADATSRNPSTEPRDNTEVEESEMMVSILDYSLGSHCTSWEKLVEEYDRDETMSSLRSLVMRGCPSKREHIPEILNEYWPVLESLSVTRDIVTYKDRIVIPPNMRNDVLNTLHSAHQGVSAMTSHAASTVYWPGITRDIKRRRDRCITCNTIAPTQAGPQMSASWIPDTPFEAIAADYCDVKGNNYLVIADRLSGWIEVKAILKNNELSGAKCLIKCLRNLFSTFGVPKELSSDGGPEFTAKLTQEFLKKWGVKHRISSAYYPQSNGRAEVAVKTTKRLLQDNIGRNGNLDNDSFLKALLTLRNTPDPSCGVSPAQIIFGHPLCDAIPRINKDTPVFFNNNIHPAWKEKWELKEKALRRRAVTTVSEDRRNRILKPLSLGDKVLIQNQTGPHPKKWDRSGVIMEIKPHDQYIVKIDSTGRITLRNRRFLKVFTDPLRKIGLNECVSPTYLSFESDQRDKENAESTNRSTSPCHEIINRPEVNQPISPSERNPTETPEPDDVHNVQENQPEKSAEEPLRRSSRIRKPKKFYDPSTGNYVDQSM